MKKISCTFLFIHFIFQFSFAQNTSTIVQEESNNVKSEEVQNKNTHPVRDLEYYDKTIEAIKIKIKHVKSDHEMNARAEADGWFEKMDSTIEKLINEREILLNKANEE